MLEVDIFDSMFFSCRPFSQRKIQSLWSFQTFLELHSKTRLMPSPQFIISASFYNTGCSVCVCKCSTKDSAEVAAGDLFYNITIKPYETAPFSSSKSLKATRSQIDLKGLYLHPEQLQLSSGLKEGANNVFSNQFGISGLPERIWGDNDSISIIGWTFL